MATTIANINTGHGDIIHDAQFDYFGRKFATCSSDHTVKVFDAAGSDTSAEPICVAEIKAHEGPVWQVAWSHPQFGSLLASCGYDRRVIVHRETSTNAWTKLYSYEGHTSSVNSIAFAPQEYGLQLASCSSDGKLSILTHKDDDSWGVAMLDVCPAGCNAVSWAPGFHIGGRASSADAAANPTAAFVKRIAVACSDHHVRIYRGTFNPTTNADAWTLEADLAGHSEWVRDVAFSPASGLSANVLVSCDDDGGVFIWRQNTPGGEWLKEALPRFPGPVWRASWNTTGNMLAITSGDCSVTLWKESIHGTFHQVTTVPDVPLSAPAGY